MLTRTEQSHRLGNALANLSTSITFKGQQGLFDDHHVMEVILPPLLNHLYSLGLINLNVLKHNHPAIDLGDSIMGKAIQVTADGSRSKMVDTLDMLEKHNLDKTYKDITFLIISNHPKIDLQRQGYSISVKNLGDIAKDISLLPPEKFDIIYNYCENQFRNYFTNNTQSLFQPVVLPSQDPNLDISNFMVRNGYKVPYVIPMNTVRNGLIELKNILTTLKDDQRWYIYKIMNYSIQYVPDRWFEYCIAPYSYMVAGLPYGQHFAFRTVVESIEAMNLGYFENEGTHRFDFQFCALSYSANLDDFNFFGTICRFLSQNYDPKALEKIVIHCDFSDIN
ncbi:MULTISPECIES: SMEK domain-containing protein [Acinetobacter]|uniref:SMEK domain-containing protein n=1 Tax=Acinetobacter corruptisaponis TaxID=3045147 RepID=A0ABY8S9K0_9GAMM|nr:MULTISPECIES: SMEK domain-containing protein [Acinetobacter]MBP1472621.1 SMEK domain-containing protein [Acinetobacter nosocomialis]WHP07788.1 SMEK domain-containing protein [Acinetobacter sp. KCTC 92772]WHP07841.1 SMEK domain-containing protein [Acinetobacter sp. KCTC 92772]